MGAHCETCSCGAPQHGAKRAKKIAAPRAGKITPAQAAKYRRLAAELCGCTLCRWSLSPALTLAEHSARIAETLERNSGRGWEAHKDWAALQSEGLAA